MDFTVVCYDLLQNLMWSHDNSRSDRIVNVAIQT
jgi:hypothetical protein